MIPIFILNEKEQKEFDDGLKELGQFSIDRQGEFTGFILRFHEDIHIKRLLETNKLEEMGED